MREETTDRPCGNQLGNGITILDYWRVLWRWRKMIGWVIVVSVIATAVISFSMTNIYQARAVIIPVVAKDSGAGTGGAGLAAMALQFGGLPGITMPASAPASEIMTLLKSNILREKMIQQYNLMPVLFYKRWDAGRQTWKKRDPDFGLNPLYYISLLREAVAPSLTRSARKKDLYSPDTWDALRLLNEVINISQDVKQNTITISADFHDPDMAAKIVEYLLVSLTNYMSSEAKRVAMTNRKYMEEQLGSTTDPFIKQKTYNMIAQQIETGMMAEVKENFAFKVIDPPLAPDKSIKPKRVQMVILALFGALFAGVSAAFYGEYLEKIRDRDQSQ